MKFTINPFKKFTLPVSGGITTLSEETCVLGSIEANKICESTKIQIYDGDELVDTLIFSDFDSKYAGCIKYLDMHLNNGLRIGTCAGDIVTVNYI